VDNIFGYISVEVNRYHILEDVVHFVVSALLCDCLASSFHISVCLRNEYPKYCPDDEGINQDVHCDCQSDGKE